jgi:DNA-binding NarL/FixJ family response regulator
MAISKMTYLICYDEHRNFSEEIKKRFSDKTRYNVSVFQSRSDFLVHFRSVKENKSCKVAIIGVPESGDQYELTEELTMEIKKIDNSTGLILVARADQMEEVKKIIKFNIDAYVPRNVNAILRIHNIVKKLISEHNIVIFRNRRNIAFYFLIAFLVLAAAIVLIALLRFPEYF